MSRYKESGVDIDAAGAVKRSIGRLARKTWGKGVLSDIGNFGCLFEMPRGLRRPVLVSSVDGVGTKLKVAFMADRHDSVGEDLVNHCVNDILVQGAEPLFFLDYFACGRLNPGIVEKVVEGLSRGCSSNGCALIGGETAEMPGFYPEREYDLAGCIVGVVERSRIIEGLAIAPGDRIWAFPSSGLHTNGYSLARKIIFEEEGLGVDDELPGTGRTVADELLEVHRSYLQEVRTMSGLVRLKGLAHITGGGLLENIPRIVPEGCAVELDTSQWEIAPVFRFLGGRGGIGEKEMYRVFNMGIGMVAVVADEEGVKVPEGNYRWKPFRIGRVVEGQGGVRLLGKKAE